MIDERKADAVVAMTAPLFFAYVQILKRNYPNYPRRIFTRNSNGHFVEIVFDVGEGTTLGNGVDVSGQITMSIKYDRREVFRLRGPIATVAIVSDIDEKISVEVDSCDEGDWDGFLELQLPYLIREAQIYA